MTIYKSESLTSDQRDHMAEHGLDVIYNHLTPASATKGMCKTSDPAATCADCVSNGFAVVSDADAKTFNKTLSNEMYA